MKKLSPLNKLLVAEFAYTSSTFGVIANKAKQSLICGLFSLILFSSLFLYLPSVNAAVVDFITFKENDPQSLVTVTSNTITYNSVPTKNSDSYIFKDETYIGNQTYTLETSLGSYTNWGTELVVWGISDTANDTYEDWNNGIFLGWYSLGSQTATRQLRLGHVVNHTKTLLDQSINLNMNVTYYLTIKRVGSNMTVEIYSDTARSQLLDTLTATVAVPDTMRYLYAYSATTMNDSLGLQSGVIRNLNKLLLDSGEVAQVFIKKIDYNAMGQKTRIEYGNGVVTTNTYDPLNLRLKRIYTINANAQVLQDLNYTYDSAGNILSITDAINTSSQTFKYDELNRLTQANGSYGTKNYQYDQIGNIVQKDGKIYSYGEGGAGIHAVTSLSDGTTMTYDANGNMASKQKGSELVLFGYDAENRLVEVKKNGVVTASYQYDGDGGRVKKTVGSTVTKYVGSLYEETNGVKTRHIFVGDMKVASVTGAQMMYYHSDHLGGTNVLTDKTGVKKELMEYEPFGMFARHDKYGTNAEVANFYFTGQRFDEESGLYYYGARYYDPSLGRFITADTVVQDPTDSQTLNRYSYTSNNPINRIDADGHKWSWKSFFGAVLGAVVGIVTAGIAAPIIGSAFAGLSAGSVGAISGALGGVVGGAAAAGISGGNILQGALYGGLLGGVAGWAGGINNALGNTILGGMFVGGVAAAAVTNSWDSLAGGLVGGAIGLGLNSFLLAQPSPGESGSYKHLSSNEIPDPIDNLARAYNDVRTNPIEKAAIAQVIVDTVNEPGLIDVTLTDFFTAATLFQGGAALRGVAALGRNLIGSVNSFSLKLGNAGFARIGNSRANAMVDAVAKSLKMNFIQRKEFGSYIESIKDAVSKPGDNNFSYKELLEHGKDFLETYGK